MRTESSFRVGRSEDFSGIRSHWGWFVATGIISLVLGVVALLHVVEATLISVMFLGGVLLVAGIFQFVQAINTRAWSGFFLHALIAIIYGAVGFLMLTHPGLSALSLTPLIASLAITAGLFRLAASFSLAAPHAGWTAVNGLLSLLLGLYVWWTWPVSSFFLLGVIIGVELLINSVPLLQLGMLLRSQEPTDQTTSGRTTTVTR
jgi:uncharacterized membrane protein HdeD (DUF308 family)